MKILFFLFTLTITFLSDAQQPADSRTREIVFKNVYVIPMDTETILPGQTVVIKDGKIISIGAKLSYDKNALVIDGKGKYLMPGLADMHGHIPMSGNEKDAKDALLLFAVNGVTTLKNMLGNPEHLRIRDKVASGEIIGPRIYTAGPQFGGMNIKTPQEGITQVKSEKQAGYDLLKIKERLSLASFEAIAKTAKEVGIPFGGHVPFDVGIFNAARLGYSTIDHLDGMLIALIPGVNKMDERELGIFGMYKGHLMDTLHIDTVLSVLKQYQTWVTPTQSFGEHWQSPVHTIDILMKYPEMKYMDTATLTRWKGAKMFFMNNRNFDSASVMRYLAIRRKVVYECQQQDIGLLLGTDAAQVFSVPGFALHRELGYFVEAGLTPYQALRTGTYNVGKFFNRIDIGVIKQGAVADLILLDANPLENIHAIDSIEGVMLDGRWLSKKEIDEILKRLVKS